MNPNEERELIPEPSKDQKLQWFKEWVIKVEKEIVEYTEEREKVYAAYKKQKDMYDHWLGKKMKKVKKFDTLVNNRKKVLIDINREINKLENETQESETSKLIEN